MRLAGEQPRNWGTASEMASGVYRPYQTEALPPSILEIRLRIFEAVCRRWGRTDAPQHASVEAECVRAEQYVLTGDFRSRTTQSKGP